VRILIISDSLSTPSGWATYATNLRTGLQECGHEVTIYDPENPGAFPRLPAPLRLLAFPFRALLLSWRMGTILQKNPTEIIHITTEPYALLTMLWPSTVLHRTVITFHGSYGVRLLQGKLTGWLLKRTLLRIRACITVSHYTKKRMVEELKRSGSTQLAQRFSEISHVIFNSVVPAKQYGSGERRPQTERNILLIGPVKPRKGVLEAMEACALYQKNYGTPFVLRIIGTVQASDYVERTKRRMADLHLENTIRLEGALSQTQLEQAYRSADLLLLPALTTKTTFEGFGLVFVEAAGYGVPSIGPNDGGAREAIGEGISGYSVAPHDPQAIAERMHWILDEHRISSASCRAWAEKFSTKAMTDALSSLYEEMKDSHPITHLK